MTEITVTREGTGPEVVLVHGGASPVASWSGLEALTERWTLLMVYRRGFPPSPPPPGGRQDFEVDAVDLVPLLIARPHVVAHSYGALGALIAAIGNPEQVRSLTLIEPPVFLPVDDPEVARLRRMGDAVLTHGLETDPGVLREFLQLAGAPGIIEGPLPQDVAYGVRRAHGSRKPSEADLSLRALRDANIPILVASGAHSVALERMADELAKELNAQRVISAGGGHFVAQARGFAEQLERFLRTAG